MATKTLSITEEAYDGALRADALVGGVARSLSVPVVTKTVAHYERFDGVSVETY